MVQAIRRGRITALQKPDGGVRGIVVGDVFRPFDYTDHGSAIQQVRRGSDPTYSSIALFTECVTHIVQALTSENLETTILSVDGIGACDVVSRNAIFKACGTWWTGTT